MAGTEQIPISKHTDLKFIEGKLQEIKGESKKQRKVKDRLEFIRLRYLGYSVREACMIKNITIQTGYNWQRLWNEDGLGSLMPNYGGGRPASMTADQKTLFENAVERDQMTTTQAGAFIKDRFGIVFTPKHIRSMLRSVKFRHAKPYDIDYRRPDDAEDALKKSLEQRWIR